MRIAVFCNINFEWIFLWIYIMKRAETLHDDATTNDYNHREEFWSITFFTFMIKLIPWKSNLTRVTLHVWQYEFQAVLQCFNRLFCHFLYVFMVLLIFDNFSHQQTSKNLKILLNFFVTIFRSETTLDCLILARFSKISWIFKIWLFL